VPALPLEAISESQVKAPSEMFAIADSRVWKSPAVWVWQGMDLMQYGLFIAVPELESPRHGKGYNVLFCDGHVSLIKRLDFVDPRKTARNWNNDNEPHPETWVVEKYP
jgi:prepilin-type processing-associated H-X9-DG protein